MKIFSLMLVGMIILYSCTTKVENKGSKEEASPIAGTWKLLSGMTIKGHDTVITDYTKGQEMIKIINDTHFAFLRHDMNHGQDSSAIFVAGGGKYSLEGNKYTEHLEYCNYREWENNSFELTYRINGDTLVTEGIEKIEELNVDHINIEKFIRIIK